MRKAAFTLLETLFTKASDHVDILQIVDAVVNLGLIDPAEESVVLNLHILAKLAQKANVVVISRID